MKTLLLLTLLASPALAQVPAHSVVNAVTIDVADTTLTVPYGPPEVHAVISVCSVSAATSFAFSVDHIGASVIFDVEAFVVSKTDSGYCTSVMAPVGLKSITSLTVRQSSSVQVSAPPQATAGSTAAQRRSRSDRR